MAKLKRPIPDLHFIQIVSSVVIAILSGLAYFFAPADKAILFASTVTLATGFLFGKFTNGFGGRSRSRASDPLPDEDTQP